jgi:hypothetical protein
MMKKEFFKSIFLSFSFALLVFAFQNCSNPFQSENGFISNVNSQVKLQTVKSAPVQTIEKSKSPTW